MDYNIHKIYQRKRALLSLIKKHHFKEHMQRHNDIISEYYFAKYGINCDKLSKLQGVSMELYDLDILNNIFNCTFSPRHVLIARYVDTLTSNHFSNPKLLSNNTCNDPFILFFSENGIIFLKSYDEINISIIGNYGTFIPYSHILSIKRIKRGHYRIYTKLYPINIIVHPICADIGLNITWDNFQNRKHLDNILKNAGKKGLTNFDKIH